MFHWKNIKKNDIILFVWINLQKSDFCSYWAKFIFWNLKFLKNYFRIYYIRFAFISQVVVLLFTIVFYWVDPKVENLLNKPNERFNQPNICNCFSLVSTYFFFVSDWCSMLWHASRMNKFLTLASFSQRESFLASFDQIADD